MITNPYSLDLTTSNYHLFSGLKKQLKGLDFASDAEVIVAAETWLDGQTFLLLLLLLLSGLQKLEQQAKKIIELRAEYVKYIASLVAVACCFLVGLMSYRQNLCLYI
jgi:hypothetical protein